MQHPRRFTARPVEYFLLDEPHADGPVIGIYQDQPIAASVIDAEGRHYAYAGIAPRLSSGRYDVEALRQGEWLVEPGLVYADMRAR
jgi:hypothetical protein